MINRIIYPSRILNLLVQYKKKADAFADYCATSSVIGPVNDLDFMLAADTVRVKNEADDARRKLEDAIRGWTIKYKRMTKIRK